MLQAMLSSNARKHCGSAMARTYARDERTYAESWLSRREILTFRNARARIRIFLSANFQGQR